MTSPAETAGRCAKAHRLHACGASTQEIADQLGVSKDTVLRDLKRRPDPGAAARHRATQADTAVRQIITAAQDVIDARPAYTLTDDATAARWRDALRNAAAQLTAAADAFADCYPNATPTTDAPREAS